MRTHHRRGFRLPPIAIAGLVVVVGVGTAWWLTRGDGSGGANPLGPDSARAGDQLLDDPYAREQAALRTEDASHTTDRGVGGHADPQPPADPPVTISQGGTGPGSGGTGFVADRGLTIDQPRTLGESLEGAIEPAQGPAGAPVSEPGGAGANPPPASGAFQRALTSAEQRLAANDPVAARSILSGALGDRAIGEEHRSQLRARLTEINQQLVFSATVVKGDPLADTYEIASGDRLSGLPAKLGLAIDWRLLQRINAIPDPDKIRLGQKIKLVRGPFHAVVDKSDYRLDLYAGPPEEEREWTYIRSFRVGLGELDSTPTGGFIVKRESKLINPHWVNPRTGERFDQNDPKNPIGERWIGLDGLGADAVKTGYGIHGTIDPGSIGQQKSMGCVRMNDTEVELVYEVLVEGISRVRIQD
ncbi:MAG: L,D-transpeptidase family protein [Phycisphaerales bacterium]|nr:L,D-transpeptidase family protein [Phycisphaerales bacterium]